MIIRLAAINDVRLDVEIGEQHEKYDTLEDYVQWEWLGQLAFGDQQRGHVHDYDDKLDLKFSLRY